MTSGQGAVGERIKSVGAGRSITIIAVVNALAKAGVELGEKGSIFPRPKGKAR